VDTPRTEDFEAAFQETLVKHFKSAASPFQPSDTDTVTSEFVQQKIKASGGSDIDADFFLIYFSQHVEDFRQQNTAVWLI